MGTVARFSRNKSLLISFGAPVLQLIETNWDYLLSFSIDGSTLARVQQVFTSLQIIITSIESIRFSRPSNLEIPATIMCMTLEKCKVGGRLYFMKGW